MLIKGWWDLCLGAGIVENIYEEAGMFEVFCFVLSILFICMVDLVLSPLEIIAYIILRVLKKRGRRKNDNSRTIR